MLYGEWGGLVGGWGAECCLHSMIISYSYGKRFPHPPILFPSKIWALLL